MTKSAATKEKKTTGATKVGGVSKPRAHSVDLSGLGLTAEQKKIVVNEFALMYEREHKKWREEQEEGALVGGPGLCNAGS